MNCFGVIILPWEEGETLPPEVGSSLREVAAALANVPMAEMAEVGQLTIPVLRVDLDPWAVVGEMETALHALEFAVKKAYGREGVRKVAFVFPVA